MSAAKRKAAKALGQGASYREAARKAGVRSRRAAKGVTVSEWMRDPQFVAVVKGEAEKAMSGPEWDNLNARQARGQIASIIECDGRGEIVRATCDRDKAMDRQGKALGKYKDPEAVPPSGGAIAALASVPPEKLATLAEAAAAVLRSVPAGA
jgi:hypothetical protein